MGYIDSNFSKIGENIKLEVLEQDPQRDLVSRNLSEQYDTPNLEQ